MIIKLSPLSPSSPLNLVLFKTGDVLTVNGTVYDFSGIPEGSTLPLSAIADEFFRASIDRIGSDLVVTLMLPNNPDAPEEARFPADIINPDDGFILLPGQEFVEHESIVGAIDWSQMITAEMKEALAEAEQLSADTAREFEWTAKELRVVADQLLMHDDDDEKAIATPEAWKDYRKALRRWNAEDSDKFPDQKHRPVRPE